MSLIFYGLDESDLGDDIRGGGAGATGVEVQADPEPQRNVFIRSDQYSFIRRGVPALTFKVGYARLARRETAQPGSRTAIMPHPTTWISRSTKRPPARSTSWWPGCSTHDRRSRRPAALEGSSFFKRFAR